MSASTLFPVAADPQDCLRIPLTIVLAEKAFPLERILELRSGVVLELDRRPDAPVAALLNGAPIGLGRAVDIGERLGFRLDTLLPPALEAPENAQR